MRKYLALFIAILLCLSLAACGRELGGSSAIEVVNEATGPNAWKVTIERIDLNKSKNKKYVKLAKPFRNTEHIFKEAKYFDVRTVLDEVEKEPDPWDYAWEYEETEELLEKQRPWNDTTEIMIRFFCADETNGIYESELLVRHKVSGKTKLLTTGRFCHASGTKLRVTKILSDTQFLYKREDIDGGPTQYFLYDEEIGETICVFSDAQELCDLSEERYLWRDSDTNTLYLIDLRELASGNKNVKRALVHWDSDYSSSITFLSWDKRFVYMRLYRRSDRTKLRGVYDVNSGEQVALFEIPVSNDHTTTGYSVVLISKKLEFVCYGGDKVDAMYRIQYDSNPNR